MSKRKKFITSSLVLALGFIAIQFLDNKYRFPSIGVLGLLNIALFIWSLRESLAMDMTLLSLILPFMFTLGVGVFWFLLPASIFARIPIIVFYALGSYALFLTSNIFTVAAIRTIALLRAARGVGFVLTLITSFLAFDALQSLRAPIYINPISVTLVSFPLFLQGLWSVTLETKFSKELFIASTLFSLVVGEIAFNLFFWPVTVVVGSLFLTVSVYLLLGLGQAKFESRLFYQTIREYLLVGILVFIGMFLSTHWGA